MGSFCDICHGSSSVLGYRCRCRMERETPVCCLCSHVGRTGRLFAFILGMWISLERPPMRTMGETRLWYSFFLPLAGIITYSRWRYKWILSFSFVLSLVFICINLFKPEIHNKTLMPALQSPWFAPHVIVYMFAYAMLGAAAVMAVYLLWIKKKLPKNVRWNCVIIWSM